MLLPRRVKDRPGRLRIEAGAEQTQCGTRKTFRDHAL